MSKKVLSIILLTGIILSACGGQGTQVSDTATVPSETTAPPATETPTQADIPVTGETEIQETNTPAATSTATIIPTPFEPDNAADCTNLASFVTDVTIPDNTPLTAGESFTKTWRVQNKGTCIWWSGYTLTYYSENAMSAPASVPLPVTDPGATADLSIDLVAPSTAGTYRGNFVIKNPEGLIMQVDDDSRLWVIVNVSAAATAAGGASTSGDNGTPVATAASSSGTSSTSSTATCAYTVDDSRTQQVVTAINNYRAQNGIVAYTVNPLLTQAAQQHAADMACNKLTYHNGSDGSTVQSRVAGTGYAASKTTENVQFNYPPYTPDQAVTWWKLDQTDPNHNKNLISTDYTEIGVGYAFFDNFGYYVVVFATP